MDCSKLKEKSLSDKLELKLREQMREIKGATPNTKEFDALQGLMILQSTVSEFEISVSKEEMLKVRLTAPEKECDGLTMEVRTISLKAPKKYSRGLKKQGGKENEKKTKARSILRRSSQRTPLISLSVTSRRNRSAREEPSQLIIPATKLTGEFKARDLQMKESECTPRPGRTTITVVRQHKQ